MAKSKNWVIVLDGSVPLANVKKQLKTQGFKVESVLKEINCITGSASDAAVKKLRSIPGITDISPGDSPVGIGPPGSPIVW